MKAKNTKGIPPGARWTRIDRRLVNPESLEEAKERFEERQDCVIVLRVLTKEEIQKFADRTNVLRGRRRRSHSTHRAYEERYGTPGSGGGEGVRRRSSESGMRDGEGGEEGRGEGLQRRHSHSSDPRSRSHPHHRDHHHHTTPPTSTTLLLDLVASAFPNLIPRTLADDDDFPNTEKRESERREQEERESRHARRNRDRRERDEYEEENSEDEFKARAPKMLEAPSAGGASGGGDTADFRERRSERERERERDRDGSYVSSSTSKRREKEDEYSSASKRRDDDY